MAVRLNAALLAGGVVLALAAGYGWALSGPWMPFFAWIILVGPIIAGSALAWFRPARPDLRRGDFEADAFMMVMSSSLLLTIPAHVALALLGLALSRPE